MPASDGKDDKNITITDEDMSAIPANDNKGDENISATPASDSKGNKNVSAILANDGKGESKSAKVKFHILLLCSSICNYALSSTVGDSSYTFPSAAGDNSCVASNNGCSFMLIC